MPENTDTLYLNVVGIPPSTKRPITNEIYFYNYDENYKEDKDKWEFDSDGESGPLFDTIADDKEFDNYRENTVSMGGEINVEVEYQSRKFVILSNDKIDEIKKDGFYDEVLHRIIK